jgi:hypothetical protein
MVLVIRNNEDRRSGVDLRKFSYSSYIPERRLGHVRRSGLDRRKRTSFTRGEEHKNTFE